VGIGTTYIFDHLKKGDAVVFNGPHGDFFLRENNLPAVLIAGGSGMAPMKSILGHMRDRKIARQTRYFFGARAPSDVFYADLMRSFESSLDNFRFIPAVAALQPGEQWQGETGRIDGVVARHLEENFPGEVYLCGSPAMIDACLELLRRKNVPENRIFFDKFA
jgi:Na+-transporting NADH:ubiquinone oxidoreductase subunit F